MIDLGELLIVGFLLWTFCSLMLIAGAIGSALSPWKTGAPKIRPLPKNQKPMTEKEKKELIKKMDEMLFPEKSKRPE